MKGTKNSMKHKNSLKAQDEKTVEVLYQKMGDRWFAFSLIGDEVFVGSIAQNEIDFPPADEENCSNIHRTLNPDHDGFDQSV